jgi:hypothetical protein
MGNFNYLCAASQQVIQEKDRCYILPIIQQTSYSARTLKINGKTIKVPGVSRHHCYPDCQWTWLGNFLEATYTDGCTFQLLNTVSNQVRMFFLAFTLVNKAAIAQDGSVLPSFDIKTFISEKHPKLFDALNAATPTLESEWYVIVPKNLAEHFESLSAVFEYIYDGVVHSMVYVDASKEDKTVTAMQFAVYNGVVFDKLVRMAEDEKGAMREFFDEAQPQTEPKRAGGMIAALAEALESGLDKFGVEAPSVRKMLNQQAHFALERLVRNLQQAPYFAPHGQYGEFEEIAHGFALCKASGASEDARFAAAQPVIEARFALNTMGREHLFITPMRTCGDEGNCYGQEYARFISDAAELVVASKPMQWSRV